MKKFSILLALILSACARTDGALYVRSDLGALQDEDKTIYYELQDSSVTAARINKVIRKRLQGAGWKTGTSKSAKYTYTILTDFLKQKKDSIYNTKDATYISQYEVFSPRAYLRIQDAKTLENVYEATIVLDSGYRHGALVKFSKVAQGSLFLNQDEDFDILCRYGPVPADEKAEWGKVCTLEESIY